MKKIYDRNNDRIICYKSSATSNFWDKHWSNRDILKEYNSISKYNLITRITKKYLSSTNGEILEAGCGIGQYVYALRKEGFICTGVDSAEKTILRAKKINPYLEIMDIRSLKFPDNTFSGYWSLGVIEHFWEGYDPILEEIYRVVKKGGYVFVTVPIMSILRRAKAKYGLYKTVTTDYNGNVFGNEFYQFILPPNMVINDFRKKGFELVELRYNGAIKGLQDEIAILSKPLHFLSSRRKSSFLVRSLHRAINLTLSPLTGHMGLFVFRKK